MYMYIQYAAVLGLRACGDKLMAEWVCSVAQVFARALFVCELSLGAV